MHLGVIWAHVNTAKTYQEYLHLWWCVQYEQQRELEGVQAMGLKMELLQKIQRKERGVSILDAIALQLTCGCRTSDPSWIYEPHATGAWWESYRTLIELSISIY